MTTTPSLADLEARLADVRRRTEKLKQKELSLIGEIRIHTLRPNLAKETSRLGCKNLKAAEQRFIIMEYISSYTHGLSSLELIQEMRSHGFQMNYNTLRVCLYRLRELKMVESTKRKGKWILSDSGATALRTILYTNRMQE